MIKVFVVAKFVEMKKTIIRDIDEKVKIVDNMTDADVIVVSSGMEIAIISRNQIQMVDIMGGEDMADKILCIEGEQK